MSRSLDAFRAEGLVPDAMPVDYRAADGVGLRGLIPRADALADSSHALREMFGRVVYRIVGYGKG